MNWVRVALTVLVGGIVASLTDWLFMGDWLYSQYDQYPEIWRHPQGQGEMKAIAWSVPLPFITCAVFSLLCARLNLHSYSATLKLALAIWLVGPLPLLITNALFIKLHPAITVSYSLGWLVKLVVAAVAVVLFLRYLARFRAVVTPLRTLKHGTPIDEFYGDRSGVIEDHAGNQWWIATRKENVSDEELAKRDAQHGEK
jgi:hypothetical protein